MELSETLVFAVIVMCAYLIEATIGFGGTVLALPFATQVLGMKVAVPAITMVIMVSSLAIVCFDFAFLHKKAYLIIVAFMLLGLPLGMVMYSWLPEQTLKVLLGVFMVFVSLKGLLAAGKKQPAAASPAVEKLLKLCVFLGGIMHGAFSCGGPFVILYATANIQNKRSFRVTLCAVWATMNAIITAKNFIIGGISLSVVTTSLVALPFAFAAIWMGNKMHSRLNGDIFTKMVYGVLLLTAIVILIQAVGSS